MPVLCNIDTCTSCQACYNACPFEAISMVRSPLATLLPSIDNTKCRECGLCVKSCPVLKNPEFSYPQKAIALYSRSQEDRTSCSSGGAATIFARHIIRQGGAVYGATAIGGHPRYTRVDAIDGLDKLKGSKYVYCDPNLIYRSVKKDLTEGLRVLFIGLPCNVAGLHRYLQKKYDNLLTIDLVCHGTPPSDYLHEHLTDKLGNTSVIKNITFRGKRDFFTTAYDAAGHVLYSKNQYEDEYFAAFMQGIFYKPACYHCQFARPERISDITIGDFWGIGKDALNGYNGKISLALLNTLKGIDSFSECTDSMIWQERQVEEAVAGNKQLNHPSTYTQNAKNFRRQYEQSHMISKAFNASGITRLVIRNKLRRLFLYLPKKIINLLRR